MLVFEMIGTIFKSISTMFGVLSISMLIVFLIAQIGILGIDTRHKYYQNFVGLMLSSIIIFWMSLIISTITNILGW